MARKTQRSKAAPKSAPTSPPGATARDKIIAAFMALLAEQRFEQIGFGDIAARAGLSLAACRGEFGSTLAIFAAHMKDLDRKVLAGSGSDMAEEPPRERLFDVLMRRIEAMAPQREAVRSLMKSAQCNPALAFALNGLAVRSQTWMLTAADIDAAGPRGMIRAQGLAMLFASVLRTWVDDEDEGLARTLAALDRALARGQRWSGMLDDLCRFNPARCVRRRRYRTEDEEPAAA
ncbi:MAG: TetR/AcrR family transcriptional regulator [Alphaproteobacteria bacterium]|nr:MAG: TetR/AcrR family transcriptional regulator [Alphaproteobacteria bacterium]